MSVENAAEEVRAKRAPKHDDATRERWRRQKRERKARKLKGGDESPKPERPPYVPDPASIQACAYMSKTLWTFVAGFTKHRMVTDEEALQIGGAIDPLLWKYLPAMADWKEELNLAMVLMAIWNATSPPPEEKKVEEDGSLALEMVDDVPRSDA